VNPLDLTLLYLLAAVLGVVACRSLKLPPMLGYLAAGVVIGPNALALAKNADGVRHLGEFGVVFLMFVIGLEFNLPKLRAMRSHVFGLGFFQVLLTMLGATAAMLGLGMMAPTLWGMGWQTALALSSALAMSSTAIVVKLMTERLEMESEHGKRVMGVLLFQDLAVVPLLVLIPALGASAESLFQTLAFASLKATLLIALLLVGGPRVMRFWLTLVARRKSEELFVLNLLFITLGLAWLTEMAGLSLALGAFIAGIGDTIQTTGGVGHPSLSRRVVGPILYQHRDDAGLATGAGTLAAGAVVGVRPGIFQGSIGEPAGSESGCHHRRFTAHRPVPGTGW